MALSKDQLKITVVLDAEGAQVGFKDLRGDLKNLQGNVLLLDKQMLLYEANSVEVSKKTAAAFARSVDKITAEGKKLVSSQERETKRVADLAAREAKKVSDTQIREAQRASQGVIREQEKIKSQQASAAKATANKADSQNTQAIGQLGGGNAAALLDGQTTSLLKLSAAVALARQAYQTLAAVFDSTAGKAIALETQIARISTVLSKAEKGSIDFTKVLLDQQKAFGTDTADTARGIYEAISSGAVDGAGAVGLLDVAQKLAIGGVTTLENSVNVLTNTMNAYGFEVSDAAKISDTLFIAAAGGKTTIAELATQLGDVTGIAKTAGINFDDLAVAVSAVTTSGQSTSLATTGVRAVIAELLTPTKNLQSALKGLGITSIETAIKQKGFVGVLRELSTAYGGNASALAGLFSRVEALPAIAALVKDSTGNAFDSMRSKITSNMTESVKVSQESFEEIQKTSEFKMKQAKGNVDSALIGIGNSFKNAIVGIASDAASSFDRAVTVIQKLGSVLGITTEKIGTAWEVTVGKVLGNKTSLLTAFEEIVLGIEKITGAKDAMDKSLAATVKISSGGDALALFQKTVPKNFQAPELVGPAKPSQKILDKNIEISGAFNKVAADEYAKSFEEIQKKTEDYKKQIKEVGLESVKAYNAQLAEQLRVINKTSDQAKSLGLLRGPFVKVFEDAKAAAVNYFNALKNNEAKKTLEDLQKSVYALTVESMKAGTDERTSIDLTLQLRIKEANALEKKYADLIKINPLIGTQIQATRDLAAAEAQRAKTALTGITDSQQNEINKALEESSKIQEEIYVKSLRATQQIDYATQNRLKEIEALDAQLVAQQAITQDAVKLFEIEQARRNLKSAKADAVAGGQSQKSALPLGGALPDFSQVLEPVTGLMSAIDGMVGIVQSLIDFIPGILNKIATVFTSLTELPQKIFEGIKNLFSAVIGFVDNFLSNIGEFIPKIIDAVITFLYEGLPKAFSALISKIPEIIDSLINSIGPLISKLVEGLVSAGPLLMISLIKSLPKLIISFITMIPKITIQLVKGLVDGLINAITGIGDAVSELFSTGITSGIESAGSAISALGSGITSQLFSVGEFAAESNAGKKSSEFSASIQNATDKSTGVFKKMWDGLMKVLTATWDVVVGTLKLAWDAIVLVVKILIIEPLKAVWDFVVVLFENLILKPLKAVWEFAVVLVENLVIKPLKAVWDFIVVLFDSLILKPLRAIWDFVVTLFDNPIQAFKDLWAFVSTMFDPIINAFKTLWNSLMAIFDPIIVAFRKLWDSLMGIFDPIISAFKTLWNSLGTIFEPIINAFKGVWEMVKAGFQNIINLFSALWDFVKTIFTAPIAAFQALWNFVKTVFDSPLQAFKNLFDSLSNIGQNIWDKIKNIGTVIWDSIKGAFSSAGNILADLFKIDFKGMGTVEKFIGIDFPWVNFAQGGVVPGQARVFGDSLANDTQPALLSPGEAVIPRSIMQDPASAKLINQLLDGKGATQAAFSLRKAWNKVTAPVKQAVQYIAPYVAPVIQAAKAVAAPIVQAAKVVIAPIIQAGSYVVDKVVAPVLKAITPQWALDLFDALKKITTQSLDLVKLISDPVGYVKGIVGSIATDLIREPAKAFLGRGLLMASGGQVPGIGDSDSVQAMLTPGEFVLNKRASQNIGIENLQSLNSGRIGAQQNQSAISPETTVNVTLNLSSGGMMDANYIRDKLMPALKDELRKESRRGGYIIAAAGVRT